jgi:hypothetical protein
MTFLRSGCFVFDGFKKIMIIFDREKDAKAYVKRQKAVILAVSRLNILDYNVGTLEAGGLFRKPDRGEET